MNNFEGNHEVNSLEDMAKAWGGAMGLSVLLGVGLYATKAAWEKAKTVSESEMGKKIKGKIGDASEEVINACIEKGKNKLMEALGLNEKNENLRESDIKTGENIRESKDYTPDLNNKNEKTPNNIERIPLESIGPEDIDKMGSDELEFFVDKVKDKVGKEVFDTQFMKELQKTVGEERIIFKASPEEQKLALVSTLKKLFENKTQDENLVEKKWELSVDKIRSMPGDQILDLHSELSIKQTGSNGKPGDYYEDFFMKEQRNAYNRKSSDYYKDGARVALEIYLKNHPRDFEQLGYKIVEEKPTTESAESNGSNFNAVNYQENIWDNFDDETKEGAKNIFLGENNPGTPDNDLALKIESIDPKNIDSMDFEELKPIFEGLLKNKDRKIQESFAMIFFKAAQGSIEKYGTFHDIPEEEMLPMTKNILKEFFEKQKDGQKKDVYSKLNKNFLSNLEELRKNNRSSN